MALAVLIGRVEAGERKARYHAAMIVAAIFNVHCDREKRPQGWEPEDFMPSDGRSGMRAVDEDLKDFALAVERGQLEAAPPEASAVDAFKNSLRAQFNPEVKRVQR